MMQQGSMALPYQTSQQGIVSRQTFQCRTKFELAHSDNAGVMSLSPMHAAPALAAAKLPEDASMLVEQSLDVADQALARNRALDPGPPTVTDEASSAPSASKAEPDSGEAKPKKVPRIQALKQARKELFEAEVLLMKAQNRLSDEEESLESLRAQLAVERKLRVLLEYDKQEAEEIAALAQGLCSGAMLPP